MADYKILGPSAPGVQSQTVFSLQVFAGQWGNDADDVQIGTATDLTPSHERTNTLVGGVGIGDRIMEIVPGRSRYTISMKKFSLWTKRLAQILGFKRGQDIRMLAEMQAPFDIKVYHINPNPDDEGTNAEVTIYRDCVIKSWRRRQEWGEEVVIADEVEMDVTYIHGDSEIWPPLSNLF